MAPTTTVSLAIAGALKITGMIEKARVYETTKHLDGYYNKGEPDVLGAWGFWVGTSLGMNLFAVCMVLIQPAAASSGIPGLISFLNGVEPPGGKSPLTKKTTSFVSIRTMVCKFLGMLASIPSGLCIGPEGPIIKRFNLGLPIRPGVNDHSRDLAVRVPFLHQAIPVDDIAADLERFIWETLRPKVCSHPASKLVDRLHKLVFDLVPC